MFFPFAKIFWIFALPSNLIVIAIVAGTLLLGTKWRGPGRRLLISGVAALLVCGLSPLGTLLLAPLENRFARPDLGGDPRAVAGIIVLGGAEDVRTQPPRELAGLNEAAERYTETVALARRFPNARIVSTGGSGALLTTEPSPAEMVARLFDALGIAKERTIFEGSSRDTHENALFTSRLVKPAAGERWLLVTSAWHMPRAMGCFRRVGFQLEAWPVDYRTGGNFDPTNISIVEGVRRVDQAAKEYVGLLAYYLAGRTDALLPGP